MFRFAHILAVGLASGVDITDILDDDSVALEGSVNLLQVAALRHSHTSNDQYHSVRQQQSADPVCRFHGDVHGPENSQNKKINYYNQPMQDPQAYGLYQVTESKDKRVSVQAFQCASTAQGDVGMITMVGYNIDGNTILVTGPNWDQLNTAPEKYKWIKNVKSDAELEAGGFTERGCCAIRMQINVNGKQYNSDDLPFDIEGTNIRLEGLGAWQREGGPHDQLEIIAPGFGQFKAAMKGSSGMVGDTMPFIYFDIRNTFASDDMIPPADANTWCTKGKDAVALDKDGDWSTSIFSVAAHHNVCDYCNGWNHHNKLKTDWECVAPPNPPPPPHPEAREECEKNGCSFGHAEELCASLNGDESLFGDCVSDFCITCKDLIAVDAVKEAEETRPSPICAQGASSCDTQNVCDKSVKMNTLKVSQNNLGGLGPDSGAEELRFSQAAVIDGKTVDLVVTADGPYIADKPSRNGNNAGGFGILQMKCGSETSFVFSVVDSATGAPVTLDNVAITWYDIDEGKKSKGRESVTVCGTSGAMISDSSILDMSSTGDCFTATSTMAGTAKDNPTSPLALTNEHLARSATFPFAGVSQFRSTLKLKKGFKGRMFMFALEPSVACEK